MTDFWRRVCRVTVGITQIEGLRMAFRVKRDRSLTPNTAEVKIWNLSDDTRRLLQEEYIPVAIDAGYGRSTVEITRIFLGQMRRATTDLDGADTITKLSMGDGEKETREKRINQNFPAQTPAGQVLVGVAGALGIPMDAATRTALQSGDLRHGLASFAKGFVASGKAIDVLRGLLKGSGVEASIQDGTLQVLPLMGVDNNTAVVLGTDSGLIGTPSAGEKGMVRCRSLLQGCIYPGRQVQIISRLISGFFGADVVEHLGDTRGGDWYTDLECHPL